MEHLRPHNDSEEQKDLPLLTKAIGEEASAEAAASFKMTKKFAPTRFVFSHLSAYAVYTTKIVLELTLVHLINRPSRRLLD